MRQYGSERSGAAPLVLRAWVEHASGTPTLCVESRDLDGFQDVECWPLYEGDLGEHWSPEGANVSHAAFWVMYLLTD